MMMMIMMMSPKVQIPNYEKVVVAAVDQKLRELRTLKQHYYPEVIMMAKIEVIMIMMIIMIIIMMIIMIMMYFSS